MRIKRKKPTTRVGRKRAAELRRILRNRRTGMTQRVAATYELDQLAPPLPPGPSLGERALHYFFSLPAVGQHQVRAQYSADDSGFGLWLTRQYRQMMEGKDSVLTGEKPDAT